MKRVITLLLALVLVFGLVGCSSAPAKEANTPQLTEEATGKEVEVDIDNWDDYFKIETTIEDFEYEELTPGVGLLTSATGKINIRIHRKVDCRVKDVSFNLGLKAYDDSWESYDNLDYVTLTTDGKYEGSFNISLKDGATYNTLIHSQKKEPGYSVLLGDLKGIVIVNEE